MNASKSLLSGGDRRKERKRPKFGEDYKRNRYNTMHIDTDGFGKGLPIFGDFGVVFEVKAIEDRVVVRNNAVNVINLAWFNWALIVITVATRFLGGSKAFEALIAFT